MRICLQFIHTYSWLPQIFVGFTLHPFSCTSLFQGAYFMPCVCVWLTSGFSVSSEPVSVDGFVHRKLSSRKVISKYVSYKMLRVWEEMYYRLASYIDASFVIDPSSSEHKRTALWCISYKKDQIVLCELDVAQIDDFHSFFYSILLSYILDSIVEVDGAISDKLFRGKTSKYCTRILLNCINLITVLFLISIIDYTLQQIPVV